MESITSVHADGIVATLQSARQRSNAFSKKLVEFLEWLQEDSNGELMDFLSATSPTLAKQPPPVESQPWAPDSFERFGTSVEHALALLEAVDDNASYHGSGVAVARLNGGVIKVSSTLRLIRRASWCKAVNTDSMERNFIQRLLSSGHFRRAKDNSDVLLLVEIHGTTPDDAGSDGDAGELSHDHPSGPDTVLSSTDIPPVPEGEVPKSDNQGPSPCPPSVANLVFGCERGPSQAVLD